VHHHFYNDIVMDARCSHDSAADVRLDDPTKQNTVSLKDDMVF